MNAEDVIRALAKDIDHTLLKPDAPQEDIVTLCEQCQEQGFGTAMVHSAQVSLCRRMLEGSGVRVGAVISFPMGQTEPGVKRFEAETAMDQGADELDYVINLTDVKTGRWDKVYGEMGMMTQLCHRRGKIVKVIFETSALSRAEIERLSQMAKGIGPDFIKTSTGFGAAGATRENVRLMRQAAGNQVKVKASGGIRDLNALLTLARAGAVRFGTSAGVAILEQARERLKTGKPFAYPVRLEPVGGHRAKGGGYHELADDETQPEPCYDAYCTEGEVKPCYRQRCDQP